MYNYKTIDNNTTVAQAKECYHPKIKHCQYKKLNILGQTKHISMDNHFLFVKKRVE